MIELILLMLIAPMGTLEQEELLHNSAVYLELTDPMALDILQKINMTHLQIKNIREMENHTQFVEDRRQIALDKLAVDLRAWELFYEDYSGFNVFNNSISQKPAWVQPVFWDLYNFREGRVALGTAELQKVFEAGGTVKEQQFAFVTKAAMTREDMINVNALANTQAGLAIEEQQKMFDKFGKFINSTEVQEKLHRYYTDYKADPDYIVSNPLDTFALNATVARIDRSIGKQCSEGFVLVYRILETLGEHDPRRWACLTPETRELWEVRGLAYPLAPV